MPKLSFSTEEILALSEAIGKMATLWDVSMSKDRLNEYLFTLTEQNTTMPFAKIMHSIALARMQDHTFPMPADILMREMRS